MKNNIFLKLIFCFILVFRFSSVAKASPDESVCPSEDSITNSLSLKESAYFNNLLAQGLNAPLESFLHLWSEETIVTNNDDTYFLKCLENDETVFSYEIMIERNCRPDVLYSWGPLAKLQNIQRHLPDGEIWRNNPNPYKTSTGVWATISPVSTFNYGLIPIRFKLKKGTPFTNKDSRWSDSDGIIAYSLPDLMDFIIPSGKYIESWSYGTSELYDEIIKDILQIRSGEKVVTYYHLTQDLVHTTNNIKRVFKSGVPENEKQTETVLKTRLLELIKMILADEGKVYYQNGVCHNRKAHYTEKPTYFNQ
ncbi:MAG: hypothetical protein PHY93_06565 [Bacteriovorax sp.]|nr:hypothetical protein [Bacteriovorax sp.]